MNKTPRVVFYSEFSIISIRASLLEAIGACISRVRRSVRDDDRGDFRVELCGMGYSLREVPFAQIRIDR